ncbi:hypothetical protein D3C71_2228200 [compost metagenome]
MGHASGTTRFDTYGSVVLVETIAELLKELSRGLANVRLVMPWAFGWLDNAGFDFRLVLCDEGFEYLFPARD